MWNLVKKYIFVIVTGVEAVAYTGVLYSQVLDPKWVIVCHVVLATIKRWYEKYQNSPEEVKAMALDLRQRALTIAARLAKDLAKYKVKVKEDVVADIIVSEMKKDENQIAAEALNKLSYAEKKTLGLV